MKKLTCLILLDLFVCANGMMAQERMRVHRNYDGKDWSIPLEISHYRDFDFNGGRLNAHALIEDSTTMNIPFDLATVDSIDFDYELTDEQKGHKKYRPFTMHITTENCYNITNRDEWINCHISIDGKGEYSDFSGMARIRGRGNSTWEWYSKKPYKFKLNQKSKLLGLEKAKDWNLLANYRDVTDMMNVIAFEFARSMGMHYTNHTRFVEVFLNDRYIGTYQLTEKIEVDKSRINIDKDAGWLLSIDKDDGPELSPLDGDNFRSDVYGLPVCVKHPETPDSKTIDIIKEDFATLENAIKSHNYNLVGTLMDIPSFIGLLQLHELLENVEIAAPRSIYLFKDKGGKYTFGPVWDWDASFDFDWTDMYTGHTYFHHDPLIFGTNPYTAEGARETVSKFWRELFDNADFMKQYKDTWNKHFESDSLYNAVWEEVDKYHNALTEEGAYDRDIAKWPLTGKRYDDNWRLLNKPVNFKIDEEYAKMKKWLDSRLKKLNILVNTNYPEGKTYIDMSPVITKSEEGLITIDIFLDHTLSTKQAYKIELDKTMISELLGGLPSTLRTLNADGSIGTKTVMQKYGAWFDAKGNTVTSSSENAHISLFTDNLYTWSYGCNPTNCKTGDKYTITMQYYRKATDKTVNIHVNFMIL